MNSVPFFGVLVVFCALAVGPLVAQEAQKMPISNLIADLAAEDGARRVTATVEAFRRGKAVLPELKKAGAKQVSPTGTIDSRRLDVVYSLIEGLLPNPPGALAGYKADSFGLRIEKGTTKGEIVQIGKKHGFSFGGVFRPDGVPNCYVKLDQGRSLAEVLQSILAHEPKVISVDHTRYSNRVNLEVVDGAVRVFGQESARRYVEIVEPKTGKTVGHRVYDK